MTLSGESVVEVDLHATYWCILISMLPSGDERERAISAVQSDWYRQYDSACLPPAANVKIEVQRQCLFGRDQRHKSNPLRGQMRELYPHLTNIIAGMRRKLGQRGLSRLLTRRESAIFIDGAIVRLHELGIPAVPNHDGLIVQSSRGDEVRSILVDICTEHLGFAPKVKIKRGTDIAR